MHITNAAQIRELLELVENAQGDVKIYSQFGDIYNLKSSLSRYVALSALIQDNKDVLTIVCSEETDQLAFDKWMSKYAN